MTATDGVQNSPAKMKIIGVPGRRTAAAAFMAAQDQPEHSLVNWPGDRERRKPRNLDMAIKLGLVWFTVRVCQRKRMERMDKLNAHCRLT